VPVAKSVVTTPEQPAAAPAPEPTQAPAVKTDEQPAAESDANADAAASTCPHQEAKSRDGKVDGDIWGAPPEGSPFAKLEIGMTPSEVRSLVGSENETNEFFTWKRFIPFYIGADGYRLEAFYKGQGSLVYTGGGYSDRTGRLIAIKYNPEATGYAH